MLPRPPSPPARRRIPHGAPLAASSPSEKAFLGLVERVSPLGQIAPITVTSGVTGAVQTGNATASWQGEQVTKPISAMVFSATNMRPLKCIAQVVMSEELADLSAPDALSIVQRALVSATAVAEATKLFSTDAAVSGVSPAGLLNGVTPLTTTNDLVQDIALVLNALSNGAPSRPRLIVSFGTATRLMGLMRDLETIGVKVVIDSAAGARLIAVDADGLLVSSGGVDIQRATSATVAMRDDPASPPTSSTELTSLWQRDLVAVKVERWVAWTARVGAVATLTLA